MPHAGRQVPELAAFTDADWGSHRDDRRAIGAYIIKSAMEPLVGSQNAILCYTLVDRGGVYGALPSVKRIGMDGRFSQKPGVLLQGPMVVNADNQTSIALAKNPVFHDRSKLIAIQYHFMRDLIKQNPIRLNFMPMKDMVVDRLTKSLPRLQHEHLSEAIGLF